MQLSLKKCGSTNWYKHDYQHW